MKRLLAAMNPADTGVAGHPCRRIDISHSMHKVVRPK